MPGIQHIQEDRHYNLQQPNDVVTKAAQFFEVFSPYNTKLQECRQSGTYVSTISKFLLVTTSQLINVTVNT